MYFLFLLFLKRNLKLSLVELFLIFSGFGVYNYPNKFFRYEGEWKDGKKHGVYFKLINAGP